MTANNIDRALRAHERGCVRKITLDVPDATYAAIRRLVEQRQAAAGSWVSQNSVIREVLELGVKAAAEKASETAKEGGRK
jgi:histone H3/H4